MKCTSLRQLPALAFVALSCAAQSLGQTSAACSSSATQVSAPHVSDPAIQTSAPHASAMNASGEVLPLGATPPPGKKWKIVANDRFDADDSIRQELWNGGTG